MLYQSGHLEGEFSIPSSAVSQRRPQSSTRSWERIIIEPLGEIEHYNYRKYYYYLILRGLTLSYAIISPLRNTVFLC